VAEQALIELEDMPEVLADAAAEEQIGRPCHLLVAELEQHLIDLLQDRNIVGNKGLHGETVDEVGPGMGLKGR
jgi:hypothetical protein